jgi:hypothetical protein
MVHPPTPGERRLAGLRVVLRLWLAVLLAAGLAGLPAPGWSGSRIAQAGGPMVLSDGGSLEITYVSAITNLCNGSFGIAAPFGQVLTTDYLGQVVGMRGRGDSGQLPTYAAGTSLVFYIEPAKECGALHPRLLSTGDFAHVAQEGPDEWSIRWEDYQLGPTADFNDLEVRVKRVGIDPWTGPSVVSVTGQTTVFYRVWGGGSAQAGSWISPVRPASAAQARAGLALPPENAATFVSEVRVPAGVAIETGTVAPAYGQPGGWQQVQLLERIPASAFGPGVPLAP